MINMTLFDWWIVGNLANIFYFYKNTNANNSKTIILYLFLFKVFLFLNDITTIINFTIQNENIIKKI